MAKFEVGEMVLLSKPSKDGYRPWAWGDYLDIYTKDICRITRIDKYPDDTVYQLEGCVLVYEQWLEEYDDKYTDNDFSDIGILL